jgi:hypothetical protein
MLSWRDPAAFLASAITCPNVFILSILPNVPSEASQIVTRIYWLRGFFLADRTRSGFLGLLGPFAAVLGPTSSCGKPVKVLDFAG